MIDSCSATSSALGSDTSNDPPSTATRAWSSSTMPSTSLHTAPFKKSGNRSYNRPTPRVSSNPRATVGTAVASRSASVIWLARARLSSRR